MATSIHGWFRVRTAVIRCVSLLLNSRVCLDPFHKTEKTITGILQAPIKWQIYIHPARLTFHFRPGSCAVRDVLIHETDIVGGQGEIQRACPRRGHKDLERADL